MMLGAGSAKALGGLYGLGLSCPANAHCATPLSQGPVYSGPQITGNLPPGYQVVGACDPNTGAATGNPSTYSYVMNGSKLQCMSPAQLQQLMQPTPSAVFITNDPVAPPPSGSTGPGIINNPIAGGASGTPAPPTLSTGPVSGFNSNMLIWLAGAAAAAVFLPGAFKAVAAIPAYAAYNVSQGNAPFAGLGLMA